MLMEEWRKMDVELVQEEVHDWLRLQRLATRKVVELRSMIKLLSQALVTHPSYFESGEINSGTILFVPLQKS